MRLKKSILMIIIFAIVIILGIVILKNVILEDVETIQQVPVREVNNNDKNYNDKKVMTLQKSGSFTEIDLVHKGSGQALVLEAMNGPVLKLENFKVTPGPDLFVYLSKNRNIQKTKELGEFVSLGELKANSGDQTYTLPDNYQEYSSVVIWCRAFGVLFSVAELK